MWTRLHVQHASNVFQQVLEFCRLEVLEAPSRGIKRLHELIDLISTSGYDKLNTVSLSDMGKNAKFVKPDRMSLPEKGGVLAPEDHLKGKHRDLFLRMAEHVPAVGEPIVGVKACHRVAKAHVREVYDRLLASGVAKLIPASEGLYDSRGKLIAGGLFAVSHKPNTDRVINDRRPFNRLERRLVWAKLPHGALLTQVILEDHMSIRASGDDLQNFFYLLSHVPEWLPRNVVGEPVPGHWFEEWGCDPNGSYMSLLSQSCTCAWGT